MIYNHIELFNIAETFPASDGGAGVQTLRCPEAVRHHLNNGAKNTATYTTGCELRFVIEDDQPATITLRNIGAKVSCAILYHGSIQSGWQKLRQYIFDTPTELTFRNSDFNIDMLQKFTDEADLPFSPRVFRLMLPDEGGKIALMDIKGNVRPPREDEVPKHSLLFYGSSITHGSLACSPNGFFSQRVARALRMDAQNQGYAGSCFIEPEMAEWLAHKDDWTAMVAELGINILGGVEPDEYRNRVRKFIDTVHGANPEKYLFLIDMFYSKYDFNQLPRTAEYRRIMQEEVERIGSPYVVYFNGLSIMNGVEFLSGDMVHPNIDGVSEIANNLIARMRPYLG